MCSRALSSHLWGFACFKSKIYIFFKNVSPRSVVATNHLSASGEVPFKRLFWWHFSSLVSWKWRDRIKSVRGDVAKRQQFQANQKHCLYFVSSFSSWASVMIMSVCLYFRGYNHVLVNEGYFMFNTRLYLLFLEVSCEQLFTLFDEIHLAYYSATIHFWPGNSTFDIYRLWPVWSDFIDRHWFIPHGTSLSVFTLINGSNG